MSKLSLGPAELSIKSTDATETQLRAGITVKGTGRDIIVCFAMLAHRLQEMHFPKELLLGAVATSDDLYKNLQVAGCVTIDKAAINEIVGRDPQA